MLSAEVEMITKGGRSSVAASFFVRKPLAYGRVMPKVYEPEPLYDSTRQT
jgi:hypothetical protein